MSDLARRQEGGLPSIEKARALLTQCRSVQECMRIKALAQAVASCADAEGARNEAAAIVLLTKARVGELTAALPKAARGGAPTRGKSNCSKAEQLFDESLSRKEAAECEKIASLKASGDLDRMLAESKTAPTTSGALALHRLPPAERTKVLGKLADDPDMRKAIGSLKLDQKNAVAASLRSKPTPPPSGPFGVIAIDPPWRYEKHGVDAVYRSQNPYPDMSLDEIAALPVVACAEPDCVLWLWTTNTFMREAYDCLDAWGFTAKTILTWVKDQMGTGAWLRGQTEHCILAVRGKPVVTLSNQTTVLRAKRREHSRKPDEFYALVDALCPGSKLEMFAREARPGWAAWGAESDKFNAGDAAE